MTEQLVVSQKSLLIRGACIVLRIAQVACVAPCLIPQLAHAQQEVDRANISSLGANSQLERVEVRRAPPTDNELRRRQAVARQIYGREELDRYGDTQLSDVLKRLPGVNITDGQLRMRGLSVAYAQILLNGEPAPPGFSLDNLNPQLVERVEVTKAPTADQSAQAIAGTLNIVLREPPRVVQQNLRLGWIQANDKPAANATFTYGNRSPGGMGFTVPVVLYNWHWKNRFESERKGEDSSATTQALRTSGFDHAFGRGFNVAPRVTWTFGEAETLSVQGYFVDNRFNNEGENHVDVLLGSAPPSVFDLTNSRTDVTAARLNVNYTGRLGQDDRIELRSGLNRGGTDFYISTLGRDKNSIETIDRVTDGRNRYRSTSFGGQYSRILTDRQTVAVGGEFERRANSEVRRTLQNGQQLIPGLEGLPFAAAVERLALFAQHEWEVSDPCSVYFGIRYERISTASDGDHLDNVSSVTTPVLHLTFKPDPAKRDVIRASVTRSYKAPDIQQLIARPTINTEYPVAGPNTQTAPDRIGNAGLRPELASGLDITWERYMSTGGIISLGMFHRRISNSVRSKLEFRDSVYWAPGPRWVALPVNVDRATTQGLEVEIKGRASELLPYFFEPNSGLSVRTSINVYRSSVRGVPGPGNRLEGQQPWQFNFGADYRARGLPISLGISGQMAPRFNVRQSSLQSIITLPARSLDAYASMKFNKQDEVRLTVYGLFRPTTGTRNVIDNGDYNFDARRPVPWTSVTWDHKL